MSVKEKTIAEFTRTLSSKAPIPGGGGAAALGGVLGNALGQMVANLTLGKKKYADVEEEIREALMHMERLQEEFFVLADKDEEVFLPLSEAYALPSHTEEEKQLKQAVMEERLFDASMVPLTLMRKSMEMLEIMEILGEKGSRIAISDVGVGVQFVRTALSGAAMNVWINTQSMKERDKAETIKAEAEELLQCGMQKADQIYQNVAKKLK